VLLLYDDDNVAICVCVAVAVVGVVIVVAVGFVHVIVDTICGFIGIVVVGYVAGIIVGGGVVCTAVVVIVGCVSVVTADNGVDVVVVLLYTNTFWLIHVIYISYQNMSIWVRDSAGKDNVYFNPIISIPYIAYGYAVQNYMLSHWCCYR